MKKYTWFLIICLALTSGILLIDGFVFEIPNWIAACAAIVAAVCLFLSCFNYFKSKSDRS